MSRTLKVLSVHASGRKTGSTSRQLAGEVLDKLSESITTTFVERDLADGVPHVNASWIGANFTPEEDRSAEQSATLSYSDELVSELKAADVIVISTPVYNFSIPAALKAWVDQIARARLTFKYTPDGPVGLLEGKRAIIVVASGGTAVGSEIDFATPYLKHVLGFVGITDVSVVAADQQMADADAALNKARGEITETIGRFARQAA